MIDDIGNYNTPYKIVDGEDRVAGQRIRSYEYRSDGLNYGQTFTPVNW